MQAPAARSRLLLAPRRLRWWFRRGGPRAPQGMRALRPRPMAPLAKGARADALPLAAGWRSGGRRKLDDKYMDGRPAGGAHRREPLAPWACAAGRWTGWRWAPRGRRARRRQQGDGRPGAEGAGRWRRAGRPALLLRIPSRGEGGQGPRAGLGRPAPLVVARVRPRHATPAAAPSAATSPRRSAGTPCWCWPTARPRCLRPVRLGDDLPGHRLRAHPRRPHRPATKIESRLPFTLSPKVPLEVTATDRITCRWPSPQHRREAPVQIRLAAAEGHALSRAPARTGWSWPLTPGRAGASSPSDPRSSRGQAVVRFEAGSAPSATASRRRSRWCRRLPHRRLVQRPAGEVCQHKLRLPERWAAGHAGGPRRCLPLALADLQKGSNRLLREPCGLLRAILDGQLPQTCCCWSTSRPVTRSTRRWSGASARRSTAAPPAHVVRVPRTDVQQAARLRVFGGTAPPHEGADRPTACCSSATCEGPRGRSRDDEADEEYLLGQRHGKGGSAGTPRPGHLGRAPEHVTTPTSSGP